MSWEAAGVVVALCVGLTGLVVGIPSLRRAGEANAIAREAIEHSRRSAEAADRAVAIGDESNVLQRHGLHLDEARHQVALSANLDVRFLYTHEASKRFVFKIVNKGPQYAKKVNVIYRDGDHEEELVPGTDLRPGEALNPECTLGALYGADRITASPDGRAILIVAPPGAQEGELNIAYRDGNGPQVLKKRVLWSDAPFSQRNISVEDWPEE